MTGDPGSTVIGEACSMTGAAASVMGEVVGDALVGSSTLVDGFLRL